MEEVEVPSYFTCPISLQIMGDPVTLCTGITYDRESIEQWVFVGKNNTCPATKQVLSDKNLTPNHNLRRMIQHWCSANSSKGIEQIPTPRAPVDRAQIIRLIKDSNDKKIQMGSLRKLHELVLQSERNRQCAEDAGVHQFLFSLLNSGDAKDTEVWNEAIAILHGMKITEYGLRDLVVRNENFIETVTSMLRSPNYDSRSYALFILKDLFQAISPVRLTTLNDNFFVEIVKILTIKNTSFKTIKSALRIVHELSPWGRNRIRFVDAGAVPVLIDLLLETHERRSCEMILAVVDHMCCCSEGRQELLKHAAGVAVLSKNILGISGVASERAVRILHRLSRSSATKVFLTEMLQVGAVNSLCIVVKLMDDGSKAAEKAREILRLHERSWKNSLCIAPQLFSSYPTNLN